MKKGYSRTKERNFIWRTNCGKCDSYCKFERRNVRKYWDNYGEVLDTMNSADGDPWDICAFGYSGRFRIGKKYRIRRFLGELKLPNGNHKLIVEVDSDDAGSIDPVKFEEELLGYVRQYERFKKWKEGTIKITKFEEK
jgi:inorganic pyrophosphatase